MLHDSVSTKPNEPSYVSGVSHGLFTPVNTVAAGDLRTMIITAITLEATKSLTDSLLCLLCYMSGWNTSKAQKDKSELKTRQPLLKLYFKLVVSAIGNLALPRFNHHHPWTEWKYGNNFPFSHQWRHILHNFKAYYIPGKKIRHIMASHPTHLGLQGIS